MDILAIIDKKRLGQTLTDKEIKYAFMGYLNGDIKDYQMSSLLMAIVINGCNFKETIALTDLMLKSGKYLTKKDIKGIRIDKHSTGGVGDKTSMIIGPILASLGLKMGKLSGKGLGFTGGTIDKLDSIPGFNTCLTIKEFIKDLDKVGFAECAQTDEFTPLDKVIYSLRSATGTVESIPLIASSIMSKKLALGASYILIDLKLGSGALIKTIKDANKLSNLMKKIGKEYGVKVIVEITDMNTPLGDNIGNALEVIEAHDILNGKKGNLYELCVNLSSKLYKEAKNVSLKEAKDKVKEVIDNKKALQKFYEFIETQGGDYKKLKVSNNVKEIRSTKSGYIKEIDAKKIGVLSLHLGAGRVNKEDKIDYSVGVVLTKHKGDYVKKGDVLCQLYQKNDKNYALEARNAFKII